MSTAVETPHALYRFFDDAGTLLYVGISLNPPARWAQHRSDKPWWREVATVTVQPHENRAAAIAAETAVIHVERPVYNVAGVLRRKRPTPRVSRPPLGARSGALSSAGDLADLLGVTRQRVTQMSNQADFPEPIARLKMGSIWRTADVMRWAEEHGREIHE